MIHHLTKILYIQFVSFGDVIVSSAMIKALKEKHPNSQIDYLTTEKSSELLRGNPLINKIYTGNPYPKMEDYDIILRPYYCLQRSGGWHLSGKHFMDLYAEICGVDLKGDYSCYFYNIADSTEEFRQLKYVTIQCKTNDPAKDWDRFPELVEMINNKLKISVLQLAGSNDPEIPGVRNINRNLPWCQVATIIKHAMVNICLDSAIQHLAGALEAPYIALYGAKDSRLVTSGKHQVLTHIGKLNGWNVRKQIALNPIERNGCEKACMLAVCNNPKGKCINNTTPQEVFNYVEKVVGVNV